MTERCARKKRALRDKVTAEEKRYEAELENAQERLVRSERLASVGRLSAGLAHEIGNPLSAVLGFQELMLSGGLDPEEERDFLVRMKRETERITKILRDLLDFARPAAMGPTSDVRGRASVAEAASDVVALVKPQKPFRDVALELRSSPVCPESPSPTSAWCRCS
jgi:two-component system NtrC family sensor kinase